MADLTVSAPVDTFMQALNQAEMRAALNSNYQVVAGVIRPDASGIWSLLTEGNHVNLNTDSVSQDNGAKTITLNYASAGFSDTVSWVASGDEQLCNYFNIGSSVGITATTMQIRPICGASGRVFHNGTSWSIESDLITGTYSNVGDEKQWELRVPFWCQANGGVVCNRWTGTAFHGGWTVVRASNETVDSAKTKQFTFRWVDAAGLVDSNASGFGAHFFIPPLNAPVKPGDFITGAANPPTTWNSINFWYVGIFQ